MSNDKLSKDGLAKVWAKIVALVESKTPSIITGTLPVGQTKITLSSSKIKDGASIDVSTSKSNVTYENISATNGSVTITFPRQSSDLAVKVMIL